MQRVFGNRTGTGETIWFLGDIGYYIERHALKNGYKVVRDFTGHGIGLKFHEEPFVFHYGKRNTGIC